MFDTVEKIENTIERAREKLSRIQDLTLNVADGWNDLRLLDQVERGVLQAVDVTAEKAKFTAAKVISKLEKQATNWLKIKGGALGTKIGAVLGSLLGPAGTAIGGAIGGFLGEQAGEWVGDKVVKPLANTARKVAEKAIDTVKTVAKTVVSMGKQVVKKGIEFVGDIANKVLNLF
ncbi:glycine zipper domain-containing protein [Ursidibacter sp. B-7004-1]